MECANKTIKKEHNWEDIRSSRSKGGYPWTHLYKEPLEEELDPEPFTMEGLKKAKSSSTVGKSDIEIFDVSDFELDLSLATDEKNDTSQIVSEADDHSINKNTGSVTIEECEISENSQIKPETVMDSAESWDNISQYLDKEDRGPGKGNDKETSTLAEKGDSNENERKRKLSAESSYSKLSQTKSALMKRINDTKNKMKIPKLTITASKIKKVVPKKTKGSPTEITKETKKRNSKDLTNQKDMKPVYVHIPLKPPPGEEDEFSHLEFGESSKESGEVKNVEENKMDIFKKVGQTKRFGGFKNLVKQVQESKLEEVSEKNDYQPTETEMETIKQESVEEQLAKGTDKTNNDEPQKMEIVEDDISKTEFSIKTKPPSFTIGADEDMSEVEDNDQARKKTENAESSERKPDIFEHLFHKSTSKKAKEDELIPEQQVRSKSVEPERKRKYSLESSYSRKSLSKLSLMKRLKEASEKIKHKLSRASSKQQITKTEDEGVIKEEKQEKSRKKLESSKPKAPVYIHIPLKPPEGETDEFSHLEKGEKQQSIESELSSTPDSATKSGVQFIILTAPSDDEILDYNSSDVPETPSSENKLFFPSKVTELKQLAKQVVDEVACPGHKAKLDSVEEESNGEKVDDDEKQEKSFEKDISKNTNEVETKTIKADTKTKECDVIEKEELDKELDSVKKEDKKKIIVDVEDGLNEAKFLKPKDDTDIKIEIKIEDTKEKVEETTTELKSSMKIDSPKIKKKVSFKRRSKISREDSYEDIQAPEQENKNIQPITDPQIIAVQEKQQQLFFEEEHLPLQGPHVTFSEEKQEWSNMIDHEYEPVNPPPNDLARFPEANPSIYIADIDYDANILPLGTVKFETVTQKKKNDSPIPQTQDQSNTMEVSVTGTPSVPSEATEPEASNFQEKIRRQTQNLRSKFQNIKKPEFKRPEFKKPEFKRPEFKKPEFKKPDFKKFKIEKPKFNIPKIPDTAKINLPSFSLGRKHNEKRTLKDRQSSTEANDGDSKKQFFDFSTYPRIFKKKQKVPKQKSEDEEEDINVEEIPAFATVPRTKKNGKKNGNWRDRWGGAVSIRVPLHSEDSVDKPEQNDQLFKQELNIEEKDQESYQNDENVSNKPLDSSHIRYEDDIDIDDDFDNLNNEVDRERDFVDRWNKGMFNQNVNENEMEYLENFKNSNYKVTDLDSPDDKPTTDFEEANNETNMRFTEYEQDNNQNNNRYSRFEPPNTGNNTRYSSGSSLGHRRGVLEEIDSDEFIWRPKGISQEHIHMFASPELREAFQAPINTLLEMEKIQDSNNDFNDSRRSLPEDTNKRKPIRKPKRNKTPHTSNDRIAQAEEFTDDLEPLPPSRPRRRSRRRKHKNQDDIIPYRETIAVDDEEDIPMIDDRLKNHRESLGILGDDEQDEESIMSENDKIEARLLEEIREANGHHQFQYDDNIENNQRSYKDRNFPPIPPRKPKSMKSLNLSENDSIFDDISYNRAVSEDFSIGRNELEPELEAIRTESKIIIPIHQEMPPRKPSRTRSRSSLQSTPISPPTDDTGYNESGYPEPCIEPFCIQDMRDPMGYAIIDKSKIRDPPLPPPRLPPRQKRSTSKLDEDNKFFTVPRSSDQSTPIRPLRNYSTLGQMKKTPSPQNTYENKENVDISQYVEIEDEPSKELLSGDVIRKMKDRPLPAPPRPPRKSRPFRDITSLENIPKTTDDLEKSKFEETEVSTQTEPLPDDFICDELVQEPTDKIIIPTNAKENIKQSPSEETYPNEEHIQPIVEKRLITPTSYTYEEETITHGSLVVEPLNGATLLPDSELDRVPKVRNIPINKLSDDETSSIPEDFKKLADFHQSQPTQPQKVIVEAVVPEVLKTQKLQVADLDVDTLNVSKLVADKIICSDIESDAIQTGEISSKNGTLKIGDISLPPGVIEEIIKSLTSREQTQESTPKTRKDLEEKKTPITENICESSESQQQKVFLHHLPGVNTCVEHLENTNISHEVLLPTPEVESVPQKIKTTENHSEPTVLETSLQQPEENLEELNTEKNIDIDETPPVPPPRANSEHVASRMPKESNQPITSPPPQTTILEPEIDDEPPPRPPEPQLEYIPSQPPASFYALKAQKYVDDNIPVAPRRKRHTRSRARSRSTSDDSSTARISRRFPRRYSEVPLTQLSGQLIRACGNELNNSLKRLIMYVTNNVLGNVDGSQDLNVMILIVLVLIAGLILLGYGNEKTVVHLHHWEYFNPPKDL